MRIGVPKEVKVLENRVGLTPASVRELVHHGHHVAVERDAGQGIGVADADYEREGASIANDRRRGVRRLRHDRQGEGAAASRALDAAAGTDPLHVSASRARSGPDRDLVASDAVCIAYETVTSPAAACRFSRRCPKSPAVMPVQAGAHYLEKPHGGMGVLLGGVPGVRRRRSSSSAAASSARTRSKSRSAWARA